MKRTVALACSTALLAGGLIAPAAATAAPPSVIVVAPGGNDHAAGTVAAPLRTVNVAIGRLSRGGTVELRSGRYHQRVLLDGAHNITVQPYRREHAVLDGAGLTPPTDLTALVTIVNSSAITVEGLEITGYRSSTLGAVPAGIYVHGGDHGITIDGNHVHDLGNHNRTLGSFDINAHGIAVYGDDPQHPVTGLRIRGNTVDHLTLGASETVVVNGNVDGWAITGNDIHDNNNIGIDAIGYEETLPAKFRYTQLNRARNGVISGNHVARIRSQGNPAYYEDGGYCNCADGIYVDGGTRIVVGNNTVTDNDIGVEVAAENARGSADHVLVAGNHITGSLYVGIATGGYCDGGDECGGDPTGASFDNAFVGNTLCGNNRLDDGSPELLVQYYAHDNLFAGNSITATNTGHVVYGTVPNSDSDGRSSGNVSDANTFRAEPGSAALAEFGWHGKTYTGFASYRQHTGQDRHSTFRG
ncbi:MAG: DUF5123 domain-containing protein [Jatrophihabitans sp.]